MYVFVVTVEAAVLGRLKTGRYSSVIERRARERQAPYRSGAAGEDCAPDLTLRADFRFQCPFHLRVTAGPRRRPRLFRSKHRWQITAKEVYTLDPRKSE